MLLRLHKGTPATSPGMTGQALTQPIKSSSFKVLPSLSEYLLAQNQGRLCIPSRYIDDQKILQSD